LQLGIIVPPESEFKRLLLIYGSFENGKLNGYVTIHFVDTTIIEAYVVNDVIHGIVRRFVKSALKNGRRKRYNSEALMSKLQREQTGLAGTGKNFYISPAINF